MTRITVAAMTAIVLASQLASASDYEVLLLAESVFDGTSGQWSLMVESVTLDAGDRIEVRLEEAFSGGAPADVEVVAVVAQIGCRWGWSFDCDIDLTVFSGHTVLKTGLASGSEGSPSRVIDVTAEVLAMPESLDSVNRLSVEVANVGSSSFELQYVLARITLRQEDQAETIHAAVGANMGDPPARAVITSPENHERDLPQNPLILATGYEDPDGDPHAATDWEIYGSSGLRNLAASSYNDTRNRTSIRVSPKTMEFTSDIEGASSLEMDRWYWVRARFIDSTGEAGAWSPVVQFRTSETLQPPDDAWPLFGEGCSSRAAGYAPSAWMSWVAALVLIFSRMIAR